MKRSTIVKALIVSSTLLGSLQSYAACRPAGPMDPGYGGGNRWDSPAMICVDEPAAPQPPPQQPPPRQEPPQQQPPQRQDPPRQQPPPQQPPQRQDPPRQEPPRQEPPRQDNRGNNNDRRDDRRDNDNRGGWNNNDRRDDRRDNDNRGGGWNQPPAWNRGPSPEEIRRQQQIQRELDRQQELIDENNRILREQAEEAARMDRLAREARNRIPVNPPPVIVAPPPIVAPIEENAPKTVASFATVTRTGGGEWLRMLLKNEATLETLTVKIKKSSAKIIQITLMIRQGFDGTKAIHLKVPTTPASDERTYTLGEIMQFGQLNRFDKVISVDVRAESMKSEADIEVSLTSYEGRLPITVQKLKYTKP